ncbi:Protein REVEILLE 6 [Glycine max]|nr:Protein REVEILLE 6 [Glycine max]
MVSLNPNPPQTFHFFDPFHMEDQSKKVRKPYTITKSRENWTDQEHDKFLEALHLFERDWKKIEAFVGSKTVIRFIKRTYTHFSEFSTLKELIVCSPSTFWQIRSHAQKYFMKIQKNGTSEHVPPPRPKRKAAHPYPQKASKNSPTISQVARPFQSSSALSESSNIYRPDSSSVLRTPVSSVPLPSWGYNVAPPIDDMVVVIQQANPFSYCYSSSNESTPRGWPSSKESDQGKSIIVMPDFAQVYRFIGSVFDPNATNHLQTLKQMNPINVKTVLLSMRNLSTNLRSPEFENERRLLSLYNANLEKGKSGSHHRNQPLSDRSESAVLYA